MQLVYIFFLSWIGIAAGEKKEEVCEDFFVLDVQELARTVSDFFFLSMGIKLIWEQLFGVWGKVLRETIYSLVMDKCAGYSG